MLQVSCFISPTFLQILTGIEKIISRFQQKTLHILNRGFAHQLLHLHNRKYYAISCELNLNITYLT